MPAAKVKAPSEPEPVSQPPSANVEHDEEPSEDEHVEAPNGWSTLGLIRAGK
jgi:hypothetical protein